MNLHLARPVVVFVSQARGVTYTQRVFHSAEACVDLGFDVVCLDPVEFDESLPVEALRAALAGRPVEAVVFHRVVDSASLSVALRACRRSGARAIYDVDDLVFDRDFAALFAELGRGPLAGLTDRADGARRAVTQFEQGWAATPALVDALEALGVGDVTLVRNSFSAAHRAVAMQMSPRSTERSDLVIGYGSGSGTHGRDLALIAEPLAAVLRRFPDVRFQFIGREELPRRLEAVAGQVEKVSPVSYSELLPLMASWDVSLVPLTPRPFNDAKSELKLIDAALVGVPTIASPRRSMLEAIDPGRTGVHAASPDQWRQAMFDLVSDQVDRILLGARARRHVLENYGPQSRAAAVSKGLGSVPVELSA